MRPSSRLPGVGVGLALLLFLSGCSKAAPEEVESETAVPVTTAPAMVGNIRATIAATGIVTAAPGADLLVIAPEPARIAEMPKAEGDRVRTGDLLVRFEIPALAADIATRRAEVARADARLANARAAQTRARDLFDRGVAARKEVEDADRELAEAIAGLMEAQDTLAASQTAASRATIRATFDGIVAKRTHNPGDMVEAAASDPVLRVIDPRRLEISASVPIADVSRIVVGASARVSDSSGAAQAPLKVLSRPAAVETGTASVPVRLSLGAASNMAVGTPVQVAIDAEEHTGVVLVSSDAVVREADQTAVFVVNGDKAERRPIQLGIQDDTHAEVRSGVKAGEAVIVKGQAGLPDGATINVAPPEK